ncbi:uncharacterized protein [Typha angustifolia]|uniref:uncharacterized protein n=1 Tax=Typha angustifolia TaxID=59011 RepID=UPI003C30B33F
MASSSFLTLALLLLLLLLLGLSALAITRAEDLIIDGVPITPVEGIPAPPGGNDDGGEHNCIDVMEDAKGCVPSLFDSASANRVNVSSACCAAVIKSFATDEQCMRTAFANPPFTPGFLPLLKSSSSSSSIVFFLVVNLLSCYILPLTDASLLQTCMALASSDPQVSVEFCVSSLQVDPRSSSLDMNDLALIATSLAITNATSTLSKIHQWMNMASDPSLEECLQMCLRIYSNARDVLAESERLILSYRYDEATQTLGSIIDGPMICELGFPEFGIPSPMSKENDDLINLSEIALDLISTAY